MTPAQKGITLLAPQSLGISCAVRSWEHCWRFLLCWDRVKSQNNAKGGIKWSSLLYDNKKLPYERCVFYWYQQVHHQFSATFLDSCHQEVMKLSINSRIPPWTWCSWLLPRTVTADQFTTTGLQLPTKKNILKVFLRLDEFTIYPLKHSSCSKRSISHHYEASSTSMNHDDY